uniref:Kinetochore protein Spc24 n=1 Tax=Angiostrongylus cantonensis TaxID=6313 RepID=A0A0K0D3X2_ANGCA
MISFRTTAEELIKAFEEVAAIVEAEKLRAMAARSAFQSVDKVKSADAQQLQIVIRERQMELERLRVELASLQVVEQEQKDIIQQIIHGRTSYLYSQTTPNLNLTLFPLFDSAFWQITASCADVFDSCMRMVTPTSKSSPFGAPYTDAERSTLFANVFVPSRLSRDQVDCTRAHAINVSTVRPVLIKQRFMAALISLEIKGKRNGALFSLELWLWDVVFPPFPPSYSFVTI